MERKSRLMAWLRRRLFRPLVSRQIVGILVLGWGVCYLFFIPTLMGAPSLGPLAAERVPVVLGVLLLADGMWLLLSGGPRRYTWVGRLAALFGVFVLVTLGSLGFPNLDRILVVFNCLVLTYLLMGEAAAVQELAREPAAAV